MSRGITAGPHTHVRARLSVVTLVLSVAATVTACGVNPDDAPRDITRPILATTTTAPDTRAP